MYTRQTLNKHTWRVEGMDRGVEKRLTNLRGGGGEDAVQEYTKTFQLVFFHLLQIWWPTSIPTGWRLTTMTTALWSTSLEELVVELFNARDELIACIL